jgi:hypothetical protein
VDPNYSSNYYNACKFYYLTVDKVWSLIYGEIFVNLESYSKRTPEVKKILWKAIRNSLKTRFLKNKKKAYPKITSDERPVFGCFGEHIRRITYCS